MAFAIALVAGCGDDDVSGPAPAEYEQLCGQDGPVKLLDVDPARVPRAVIGREVGDRYLFTIRFDGEDPGAELWSVDGCGEDPILLAEQAWPATQLPPTPELVFVCDENTGVISALDMLGERAPNPVFETRGCFAMAGEDDVLTILGEGEGESETGPLVLQLMPADPHTQAAEQIVLLDEVRAGPVPAATATWTSNEYDVLQRVGTEVLAVTAADELVVLDLLDMQPAVPSVLAQGVREFVVGGADGRYVAWQGVEITNDDPETPEGPLFVLDRETGESAQLEDGALAYTFDTMAAASAGLLYYRTGDWSDDAAGRWVRLDTFESFAAPGSLPPIRMIDESRVLVGPLWSPYLVLDLDSGELDTIYEGSTMRIFAGAEGLEILRGAGDELLHIDYDGSSRTLADSAYSWYGLSTDEHVVTPYAVGHDGIGALVIVDPSTLDARYVDHDVLATGPKVYESEDDLLVSYAVVDAKPERHGVWLAKPAK